MIDLPRAQTTNYNPQIGKIQQRARPERPRPARLKKFL
jgi:hypothetical protein